MKRKYDHDYRQAQNNLIPLKRIYQTRPDESTLLMETGGRSVLKNNNSSGGVGGPAFLDNSSAMDGVKQSQYNNFFYQNDFFTITENNACIGLAVSYFNATFERVTNIIVPIVLPFGRLTFSDGANKPDNTPENHTALQKQLAYSLNLYWSSVGKDYIRWYISKTLWDQINVEDFNCPIFEDGFLPPLQFRIIEGGHLAVVFDKAQQIETRGQTYNSRYFAFNLVNLQSSWLNDNNYYKRNLNPNLQVPFFTNTTIPHINTLTVVGSNSGWFSKGSNVYGYGKFSSSEKQYQGPLNYTNENDIFQTTTHAPEEIYSSTFETWINYTKQNNLQTQVVVAPRYTSLVPSRFYAIRSNTLSRNQKGPCIITNNPNISLSSTIGIFFHKSGPSGNSTQEDSNGAFNNNFNPQLSSAYFESKQNIDLVVVNEYGDVIVGPSLNSPPTTNTDTFPTRYYYQNRNIQAHPRLLPIASAYGVTLNPDPALDPLGLGLLSSPTYDLQTLWGYLKSISQESCQTNPSCQMTHFVRIFCD